MTNVLNGKKRIILAILAIILVLLTWYSLKVKGITLTAEETTDLVLLCENTDEDHVHTDECYGTAEESDTTVVGENDTNSAEQEDVVSTDTEETTEDTELSEAETDTTTDAASEADEDDDLVVAEESEIETVALDEDIEESTSSQAVNIYINIDGTWTLIGTTSTTSSSSGNRTTYTLSEDDILEVINNSLELGLTSISDYYIYYSIYSNGSFSTTSLSELTSSNSTSNSTSTYSVSSSSAINIYITDYAGSSSNNNGPGQNSQTYTLTTIDENNTLQITSFEITVYEYDTDETTLVETYEITAYSLDSEEFSYNYTLSDEYNYYVDDSAELTAGGSTITITTNSVTLTRVEIVKCTITIIYADGTIETQKVNSGTTYTLPSNMKWKVGTSSEYTDGGTSITITDDITITESSEIIVTFTVDLDSAASVLGLDVEIPTYITENNELTYTVTISYDSGITTVTLTSDYVISVNSGNPRYIAQFTNWVEQTTSDTYEAEVEIYWNTLYNYAVNGEVYFNTSWTKITTAANFVNFYVQLYSQAVDTEGDVEGRPTSNYTASLWSSYVGSSTGSIDTSYTIADTTSDNSYTANANIRALEGTEGDIYIYDVPDDDYIFSELISYANENSVTLYVDDIAVDLDELDSDHYEIRWYVFKYDSTDCWHIDGKLVRREGKVTITKTFTGSKVAIEAVTGYSFDSETQSESSYYITVEGSSTETLYLTDWSSEDSTTEAYFTNNTTTITDDDGNTSTTYSITYTWVVDTKIRHFI